MEKRRWGLSAEERARAAASWAGITTVAMTTQGLGETSPIPQVVDIEVTEALAEPPPDTENETDTV